VHLWGFVVDKAGRASKSQYIGNGVLSMEEWVVEEIQDEDDTALQCDTPRPSGTPQQESMERKPSEESPNTYNSGYQ
jgi:hypothetical protein